MDGVRRILCYGVCGSGKTTLARRISEKTGIPWHSADDLTWLPGWQMVPDEIQGHKIRAITEQESWILDTAYGKWIEIPLERVELIVALDYPRWFSFQRLLRRAIARAIDKQLVCNGNIETWRNMFSRDSILIWHFKSFKNKQRRMRKWANQESGPKVIVFRNAKETDAWLHTLGPDPPQIPR